MTAVMSIETCSGNGADTLQGEQYFALKRIPVCVPACLIHQDPCLHRSSDLRCCSRRPCMFHRCH